MVFRFTWWLVKEIKPLINYGYLGECISIEEVKSLQLNLTANMDRHANKKLMEHIFSELSNGNDQPFIDAMADDMRWTWMGSGQWSKTFEGKPAVLGELWAAVRTTLKPPYKVVANRFIADGDYVAVEASGQNTTPDGKLYNNKYCWICRISEGKLHELNEYMDTQLVTETFHE